MPEPASHPPLAAARSKRQLLLMRRCGFGWAVVRPQFSPYFAFNSAIVQGVGILKAPGFAAQLVHIVQAIGPALFGFKPIRLALEPSDQLGWYGRPFVVARCSMHRISAALRNRGRIREHSLHKAGDVSGLRALRPHERIRERAIDRRSGLPQPGLRVLSKFVAKPCCSSASARPKQRSLMPCPLPACGFAFRLPLNFFS